MKYRQCVYSVDISENYRFAFKTISKHILISNWSVAEEDTRCLKSTYRNSIQHLTTRCNRKDDQYSPASCMMNDKSIVNDNAVETKDTPLFTDVVFVIQIFNGMKQKNV